MARLLTAGAETLNAISDDKSMEGSITTSGTVTVDTGTVNTGTKSFRCDAAAGNVLAYVQKTFSAVLATTYYLRAWIRFPVLPTSSAQILYIDIQGSPDAVRLNTDGTLTLLQSGSSVGSNSAALSVDAWYCIEFAAKNVVSASSSYREARINGVSFASTSTLNATSVSGGTIRAGWPGNTAPGANTVIYVDDVAFNDDSGANENTWPGLGRQVLLLPTADNAVGTGWTLGTGTATGGNAFGSVDNIPPVGVADLAVGSDPKQIRNASSNANTAYDATMTTYTAAGIAANATINLVDPMVWTAAPVVTSAKAGTVGVVSNPAITAIALGAGGTAGAFWSGVAGGTYPTGWKLSHGTLTYAPAVTLGTAPVMRINQVTASTRIAVVCFMGIYVDFTPWGMPTVVTPRSRPS